MAKRPGRVGKPKPPTLALTTLLALGLGELITAPAEHVQLPNRLLCNKDSAEMVLIAEGPFVFGISQKSIQSLLKKYRFPWAEIFAEELPEQQKREANFYIDRYEVTNSQYEQFTKETGHRRPRYWQRQLLNAPQQSVVGVGWADAEAYAKWARKRLPPRRNGRRLPAEPMVALGLGAVSQTTPFCNGRAQAMGAPIKVGSFSPSGDSVYGVSDMAGNVCGK
jgi:formylglycine-generating enzyme required for sulfatase activity